MTQRTALAYVLAGLLASAWPSSADVPGSVNYQGRVVSGASLVNGSVSLVLRLYDAPAAGTLLLEDSNTVDVVDGLYSTRIGDDTPPGTLAAALSAPEVWLETRVDGTVLSPRERVVSVAYALVAATVVTGAIQAVHVDSATFSNTFWGIRGNSGTRSETDYLGTVGNEPLVLGVFGRPALVISPAGYSPSIRAGAASNQVAYGIEGATLAGGGSPEAPNIIQGAHGVIGGGASNLVMDTRGVVPGGFGNTAARDSFAAGYRAQATNAGSFVWADPSGGAFGTVFDHTFLVRAVNGVGINWTRPDGGLHVCASPDGLLTVAPAAAGSGGHSEFRIAEDNAMTYGMVFRYDGLSNTLYVLGKNGASTSGPQLAIARDDVRVAIGGQPTTNALSVYGSAWKNDGSTAWSTTSDRRLKDDVRRLAGAMETIDRLQPVRFRFNDTYRGAFGGSTDTVHYGFIAQDYGAVFPEAVTEDGAGYLTMDSSAVVPHLVAAVQELRRTVLDLQAENAALRRDVEALRRGDAAR